MKSVFASHFQWDAVNGILLLKPNQVELENLQCVLSEHMERRKTCFKSICDFSFVFVSRFFLISTQSVHKTENVMNFLIKCILNWTSRFTYKHIKNGTKYEMPRKWEMAKGRVCFRAKKIREREKDDGKKSSSFSSNMQVLQVSHTVFLTPLTRMSTSFNAWLLKY